MLPFGEQANVIQICLGLAVGYCKAQPCREGMDDDAKTNEDVSECCIKLTAMREIRGLTEDGFTARY